VISWRRELRDTRRKGRRDGRAGVRGANVVALPFDLREILARGQEQSERVLARWRDKDQQLEAELDDLTQRAVEAETRLAGAGRQRNAAQADHERRTADDDHRLGRLQTQLEELPASEIPTIEPDELERQAPLTLVAPITGGAQSEAEPVHAETVFDRHGSPTSTDASWHGIRPVLYWPLIALIVIGEIPLNAFAFRLFHEPDVLTYAMTVTVAVGLVLLAHGLGLFLSRLERNRVERILVGPVCPAGRVRSGLPRCVHPATAARPRVFGDRRAQVRGVAARPTQLRRRPQRHRVRRAVTCLRMAPMRRPYVFRWNVVGGGPRTASRVRATVTLAGTAVGGPFGGGLISKSVSPRSKGSYWPRSIVIRTPFERSTGSGSDQSGV
jgi:hypothetical protein